MTIQIIVDTCENVELIEKMKTIKDSNAFTALADEYGFDICCDAYAAAHPDYDIGFEIWNHIDDNTEDGLWIAIENALMEHLNNR